MSDLEPGSRVAFVHDWLTGMRGGERVLEQMLDLTGESPIYTLFHFDGAVSPKIESHPVKTSRLQHVPGARRHYRRLLPLFPRAIEQFDFSAYDVVLRTILCGAKLS